MAQQEFYNEKEYIIYIKNLSEFAKKYSLPLSDLNLIDLTLERLPEMQAKVINLKNQPGITIESVLKKEELKVFMECLNSALKIYKRNFKIIASKLLQEKAAIQIFYANFTIKKDFARKLLSINKETYTKLTQLDNSHYFTNLEDISGILRLDQYELKKLIDDSIDYWRNTLTGKQ